MNAIRNCSVLAIAALGAFAIRPNLARAAEASPSVMMKPAQPVALDAGPRHIVSSFVVADGQCSLSAMISEAFRDHSSEVVRVETTLPPGGTSRIDAGAGYLLQYACESGAHAMTATMLGEARSLASDDQTGTFAAAGKNLAMQRATGI
jgi:hypothetical protein